MEYIDLGLPSGLKWSKDNLGEDVYPNRHIFLEATETFDELKERVDKLDLFDDEPRITFDDNCTLPTKENCLELLKNTDIFLVLEDDREVTANLDKAETTEEGFYKIPWMEDLPLTTSIKGCKFCKKDDHSIFMFIPALGAAVRDIEDAPIGRNKWCNFWTIDADKEDKDMFWFLTIGLKDISFGLGNSKLQYPCRLVMA